MSLSSFELSIRSGHIRILPIGHRQVEEAWNLVQLLNLVGETALSVGRCLQCVENIILVGAPVGWDQYCNAYNKMHTKFSVNLIFFQRTKQLKQTKNKRNKTLIKFKINLTKANHTVNNLIFIGTLAEKGRNGGLFDSAFSFLNRKLTDLEKL